MFVADSLEASQMSLMSLLTSPSSSSCSLYRDSALGCDGVCCVNVETLTSWTDAWGTDKRLFRLNTTSAAGGSGSYPLPVRGGHLRHALLLHLLSLLLPPLSAELLWVDVDDLSDHLQPSMWIETPFKKRVRRGLWVMTSWYLSVGLLCDVNVLGSVGLTSPLIVPHLCHQLQVSLWFILLFTCRGQTDRQAGRCVEEQM